MIAEVRFIRLFVIRYRLRANIKYELEKNLAHAMISCVHVNFYARMQNIVHAREKSCTRKKFYVRIQIWYTHEQNLARAKISCKHKLIIHEIS